MGCKLLLARGLSNKAVRQVERHKKRPSLKGLTLCASTRL